MMRIADTLLPEFDYETQTTRKLLERIPSDRGDWKPHEKSYSIGTLGLHLVNLPYWLTMTLLVTDLDLGQPFPPRHFHGTEALLEEFDRNVKDARELLAGASNEDLMTKWTLRNGDNVIFTLPRVAAIRSFVMNHLIHHRGQLSVYLRLLDIPVPSVYGPTADEAR